MTDAQQTRQEQLVAELSREDYPGPGQQEWPTDSRLTRLRELGTELWLDTGDLEQASSLWHREFSALTTNNTLANQVVQTGILDDVIRTASARLRTAAPSLPLADLVLEIGFIINCRIALRLVERMGAMVSVELHPAVAHDLERTVRFAERYYAVCPDHFLVKIPLSAEGYCAVVKARAQDIPINYTLGFSARQNYLATIFSRPKYVNVFLGRLNQVVVENKWGDGKYVGEKATLASQGAVLTLRRENPEIETQQIAASMRGASQVSDLAGVDVYTMPPKVAQEFLASSIKADSLASQLGRSLSIDLSSHAEPEVLAVLWDIDDRFTAFANDVAKRRETLSPKQLIAAARDHKVDLFHDLNADDLAAISKGGKIPDLLRWHGRIALDALMTEAALQSFTVDQQALDDRIKSLIA